VPGASITQIRQILDTALLVTVAEDLLNEPTLKVWALDKTEKKTGGPKCLCTIGIQNQRKLFPISAFVVLGDLSQVAVGFANGAVTVIRGDLIHDRGTKQRTVFDSPVHRYDRSNMQSSDLRQGSRAASEECGQPRLWCGLHDPRQGDQGHHHRSRGRGILLWLEGQRVKLRF
jgi:hypothetical protein